jgi:hypothetical protein
MIASKILLEKLHRILVFSEIYENPWRHKKIPTRAFLKDSPIAVSREKPSKERVGIKNYGGECKIYSEALVWL